MKIYWSANKIPELAGLSDGENKKVLRTVYRGEWKMTMLSMFLLVGIVSQFTKWYSSRMHFGFWQSLACAGICGAVFGLISGLITQTWIRPRIRRYRKQHSTELKAT